LLRISTAFVHCVDTLSIHQRRHSSKLTNNSQTYSPNCRISNYYYETIEINVKSAGLYTIASNSRIDTYGYIYEHNFNPFKPFTNLILKTDGYCDNDQFELALNLLEKTTYILVITTIFPNVTGNFSVSVSGPSNISLNHTSEYIRYLKNNSQRNTENVYKFNFRSQPNRNLKISNEFV